MCVVHILVFAFDFFVLTQIEFVFSFFFPARLELFMLTSSQTLHNFFSFYFS